MAKLKFEHLFLSTHGLVLLCFCKRLGQFPLSGTFLSPKDFANGAKYNKEYASQDNSSKRADFDQAMQFHQDDQVF